MDHLGDLLFCSTSDGASSQRLTSRFQKFGKSQFYDKSSRINSGKPNAKYPCNQDCKSTIRPSVAFKSKRARRATQGI